MTRRALSVSTSLPWRTQLAYKNSLELWIMIREKAHMAKLLHATWPAMACLTAFDWNRRPHYQTSVLSTRCVYHGHSQLPESTSCFGDTTAETRTRHRNPLFSHGILAVEALQVDELHTLRLGVFSTFVVRVFWQMILLDVWRAVAGPVTSANQHNLILRLRSDLFQ